MNLNALKIAATVTDIIDAAPQTRIIRVKPSEPFGFKAGQYAQLQLGPHEPRPYSIASAPFHPYLEFHIKDIGHGGSSTFALTELQIKDEITVFGPYGHNFLHSFDRPLLAIGGGLGIAPLKSIVEAALHDNISAPLHLYFGARVEKDLYLKTFFEDLTQQHKNLRFTPVISDEPETTCRTGFVGQVAAQDFEDLSDFQAYLAGPNAMIADTIPRLKQKNMEDQHIFNDAFDVITPEEEASPL